MAVNWFRQFVLLALLVIAGCASLESATIVHRMQSPMEPQDAEGPRLLPAVRPTTVMDNDPHLISEATPEIQIEYEDFPNTNGPVQAEFSGNPTVEPLSALANLEVGCDDALFSNRLDEPLGGTLTYTDLFANQAEGVVADLQQFYSVESMAYLAGGLAAGAMMANTGFDERLVRDAYLENVVLAPSDEIYESLHQPKFLGDGTYTIPAFAIAALAEPIIDDLQFGSETAQWGQRSLRTVVVGAPPLLGLQWLTGGGRPGETSESSEWRPFQDNNGVSGHSFMGAIPFMSAAKMTDNIWLKGGLYAVSTLPALSRVNDDAHYFSQAFLGWWLAYLAESAVDRSFDQSADRRWHIYPSSQGTGVVVSTQW